MDVFPVHEGSAPLGYVPIYPIWPKHHPMGSPPYPVAHKSGQEPAMEITDVPVMITTGTRVRPRASRVVAVSVGTPKSASARFTLPTQ
jgi:hypothetical protein